MENSEFLFILGDPDLELEPFAPTCLDQCATPVFSFLSPVSSPSSTTVDSLPPNEQSNPQTRSIANSPPASPTTNELINNSIPPSAIYPESEGELLRPTHIFRQKGRPFSSSPKHSNSRNNAKSVALYKQHRREHFASRARIVKKPRFNRRLPYKLKPEFSSWEILYWDSTRQEFTLKNNSTISTHCHAFESNYSSPASMTLNPFAPTFCPQQRPKPYSSNRPKALMAMNSPEPSNSSEIKAKASTANSHSPQIEKQTHSLSAQLNQLQTHSESAFQQTTPLLQKFPLAHLKQVQYLQSVQLTVAKLHQDLESQKLERQTLQLLVLQLQKDLMFTQNILMNPKTGTHPKQFSIDPPSAGTVTTSSVPETDELPRTSAS